MWINTKTGQRCSTHSAIRATAPQVSMPADMTEENIASLGFVPFELPVAEKAEQDKAQKDAAVKVEMAAAIPAHR